MGKLFTILLLSAIAVAGFGYVGHLYYEDFRRDQVPVVAGNVLADIEEVNIDSVKEKLPYTEEMNSSAAEAMAEKAPALGSAEPNDVISKSELLQHVSAKDFFLKVLPYKDLELYNIHTDEKLETIFWVDGKYIPEALNELDQFWRDWRRYQVIDVDPKLYSLLHDLYNEVGGEDPIHLISGHRSEKTNKALRAAGRNTAKKSQHVLGRAADITIPGVAVKDLRDEALAMQRGGVGYYPQSHFVHVDTGRVRQWQGK
jgi:uncharacterized protein YcbK (DUF882 family)